MAYEKKLLFFINSAKSITINSISNSWYLRIPTEYLVYEVRGYNNLYYGKILIQLKI